MTFSKQTAFLADSSRLLQQVASIMDADPDLLLSTTAAAAGVSIRVLERKRERLVGLVKNALENSFLLMTEVCYHTISCLILLDILAKLLSKQLESSCRCSNDKDVYAVHILPNPSHLNPQTSHHPRPPFRSTSKFFVVSSKISTRSICPLHSLSCVETSSCGIDDVWSR